MQFVGVPPRAVRSLVRRSAKGHWALSTVRYDPLGVLRGCPRRQCVLCCAGHRCTIGLTRLVASVRSAYLSNCSFAGRYAPSNSACHCEPVRTQLRAKSRPAGGCALHAPAGAVAWQSPAGFRKFEGDCHGSFMVQCKDEYAERIIAISRVSPLAYP